MTIKELRQALENFPQDDNAPVYIELELGENVFVQKPIEHVRMEMGSFSCYIIAGITGDQSNQ